MGQSSDYLWEGDLPIVIVSYNSSVANKGLPKSKETIDAGTIEAGVRRFVVALRWLASDPQSFPIPIPSYAVRSQEIVNYFSLFYETFRLIHLDMVPDDFKTEIGVLVDAINAMPAHLWSDQAFSNSEQWQKIRTSAGALAARLEAHYKCS